MGKAYDGELGELPNTYRTNLAQPYEKSDLACWKALGAGPLVAIGVGGSFAAAELACLLHRRLLRLPARSMTTLRALEEGAMGNEAALVISAGGRNKDVMAAFEASLQSSPRDLFVITANADSPLARRAREADYPGLLVTQGASKDGFLATNTLLAAAIHLYRVYGEAYGQASALPPTFAELLHAPDTSTMAAEADEHAAALKDRTQLLVLYGANAAPAAVDFEARINESGLGVAHLADFRSFAHGRHYWLHHQARTTAIVAFVDRESKPLADKTLAAIPETLPRIAIEAQGDSLEAALELMVRSMYLCGALGRRLQHDPGRPHVPAWGRQIYAMGPRTRLKAPSNPKPPQGETGAVVFDVDGTLLERRERYGTVRPNLASELRRLASEGVVLGFATGRGQSLHKDVLAGVFPASVHDRIVLGYYNGTVIRRLTETTKALGQEDPEIAAFDQRMKKYSTHLSFATELRGTQVAYSVRNAAQGQALLEAVHHEMALSGLTLNIGTSTLGIDVFSRGRGKMAVVEAVARIAKISPDEVTRVGDCGGHDGNDATILNHARGFRVGAAPLFPADPNFLGRGPARTLAMLQGLRGPRP